MAKWFGLDRLLSATSRKALNTWVTPQIVPENASDLHLDPNRPICYVLQSPSFSNLLVIDEAAQQLKLPRPVNAIDSDMVHEKQAFFYLTQETTQQSAQKTVLNILNALLV